MTRYRRRLFVMTMTLLLTACDADQQEADTVLPSDATSADASLLDVSNLEADAGQIVTAPGPSPRDFDCRADFIDPGRVSPVPLSCVIDPACDDLMIVGHRGAGGDFGTIAPENSLAAIRAALIMGVDGVELDVRHTSDEQLVVIHDTTVDRTTEGTGLVAEMTATEVTELSLTPGPLVSERGEFECERVPLLEAAIQMTRDKLFIDLDVKTDRIDLVVAELRRLNVIDQVFISVSDVQRAVLARTLAPEVRVQVRPDDQGQLDDHLVLFSRAPDIVEIPPGQVTVLAEQIRAAGSKVFSDVFGSDVIAGVVGDVEVYRGHYTDGAQILQSEYPQLVLQTLGRWTPPAR